MRRLLRALLSGRRVGQFLSVGVLGAVIDTVGLLVLVEATGADPTLAKVGSAELSICVMFVLNEYWTFRQARTPGRGSLLRRFGRSNLVRWVGAGIALCVLTVLNGWFGVWYVAANVAGIGVGFVVNYVAESTITWRIADVAGENTDL
ncbi:GtrA family protein [Halarchaeum sp. P4]|uniref:GtrA family protein n=1 Tax=Halarchaeum sp. P4 TaxID=3421639 RepID=UPI003EBD9F1A